MSGMTGKKHSEETKEKIRLARAKQVFSREAIEKRKQTRAGYRHTDETIEKIKEGNKESQFKKGQGPWNKGNGNGWLDKSTGYKYKSRHKKEHRYIMEQHLGRELSQEDLVHHINFDKTDNELENLQIMSRKEHNKLHFEYDKR